MIEKDGRYGPDNPKRAKAFDTSYMKSFDDESELLEGYLKGRDDPYISYAEVLPQRPSWCRDLDSRWKLLLLSRQVKGMSEMPDLARKKQLPMKPNTAHNMHSARVGTALHPYNTTGLGEEMDLDDVSLQQPLLPLD